MKSLLSRRSTFIESNPLKKDIQQSNCTKVKVKLDVNGISKSCFRKTQAQIKFPDLPNPQKSSSEKNTINSKNKADSQKSSNNSPPGLSIISDVQIQLKSENSEIEELINWVNAFFIKTTRNFDTSHQNYLTQCKNNFETLLQLIKKNKKNVFKKL